ncbi:MAG: CoA transferase, partial [Methylocystaceae bacterium]|nr:CoA transferase [Methylocystaceae bacterium]
AAFAISAALVDQRTTGKGRRIDVSLLEATVAAMGWVVSNYLNAGVIPEPMGNENFTAAPSGTFRTATGPLNIAANEQKQYESLCNLVERPDLKTDPRFSDRQSRKLNRASLTAELEIALAVKGAEEWETLLNTNGVPAGQVLTVPQVLQEAQIYDRGFVEEVDCQTSAGKRLRVTRPGFLIDADYPRPSPPPMLGQHTEHWLRELGYDIHEIDRLGPSAFRSTQKS